MYPYRQEEVCCKDELKIIDPSRETCCENQMISYNEHKCCNDQVYNATSYCPIQYTNYLKPYFDWYPKRFVGKVPNFRTRTKKVRTRRLRTTTSTMAKSTSTPASPTR